MEDEILDLFDEFETDVIEVSDFNIKYNGTLITHLRKKGKYTIEIWAGNPDTDKYAEQLFPYPPEREEIFNEIISLM